MLITNAQLATTSLYFKLLQSDHRINITLHTGNLLDTLRLHRYRYWPQLYSTIPACAHLCGLKQVATAEEALEIFYERRTRDEAYARGRREGPQLPSQLRIFII